MTEEEAKQLKEETWPATVDGVTRPTKPITVDMPYSEELPQMMSADWVAPEQPNTAYRQLLSNDKAFKDGTVPVATATKLQTARTISLSGGSVGEVAFDGSKNVNISTTTRNVGSLWRLHRNEAHVVGVVRFHEKAPSWSYLECVTAGTTSSDEPTFSGLSEGDIYTDGTAKFQLKSLKNADKLTTARTISLTGGVTGSATFDGSANVSITANDVLGLINVIQTVGLSHNGIYRGKNLGTISSVSELETFLTTHKVSDGLFTDLYIGDYFTLKDGTYNKEWEIAGFDTYLYKGDTSLTKHHLALIPKTNLLTSYMNATDTTEGAYYNSYMHQTIIPQVDTNMTKVLGTHLLERRANLTKTMTKDIAAASGRGWNGSSTAWDWYTVKSCLMSEVAVYGSTIFSSSGNDVGEDCERLPIFQFKGHSYNRAWFWLRAVASSSSFATASATGFANYSSASGASGGVRPLICVG